MLLIFTSLTGNVRRFVDKLDLPTTEWHPDLLVDEPFVFATYTAGFGSVPQKVMTWLESQTNLKGVICSGNRNWGTNFCMAGKIISKIFKVPLIHTFELSGTPEDVEIVRNRMLHEFH